jgi:hypothetical protein
MTANAQVRTATLACDGVTTVFSLPFGFDHPADLRVTLVNGEDVTPLAYPSGFGAVANDNETATLTTTTVHPDGATLQVARETQTTQTRDFKSKARIDFQELERALDKLARGQQDEAGLRIAGLLAEAHERLALLARAIVAPESDGAVVLVLPARAERRGKLLLFDPETGDVGVLDPASLGGGGGGGELTANLQAVDVLTGVGYLRRTGVATWTLDTAIPQGSISSLTGDLASLQSQINAKASQASLNSLTTTVGTKAAQADLTALATTVGTKALKPDGRSAFEVGTVTQPDRQFLAGGTLTLDPANPRHRRVKIHDSATPLTQPMTVNLAPAAAWETGAEVTILKGDLSAHAVTVTGLDTNGAGTFVLQYPRQSITCIFQQHDTASGPGPLGQAWERSTGGQQNMLASRTGDDSDIAAGTVKNALNRLKHGYHEVAAVESPQEGDPPQGVPLVLDPTALNAWAFDFTGSLSNHLEVVFTPGGQTRGRLLAVRRSGANNSFACRILSVDGSEVVELLQGQGFLGFFDATKLVRLPLVAPQAPAGITAFDQPVIEVTASRSLTTADAMFGVSGSAATNRTLLSNPATGSDTIDLTIPDALPIGWYAFRRDVDHTGLFRLKNATAAGSINGVNGATVSIVAKPGAYAVLHIDRQPGSAPRCWVMGDIEGDVLLYGTFDGRGNVLKSVRNKWYTGVSGLIPTEYSPGNIQVTGNVEVPDIEGWEGDIFFTGAYTITHNGLATAAFANGDIATVKVGPAGLIDITKRPVASRVALS